MPLKGEYEIFLNILTSLQQFKNYQTATFVLMSSCYLFTNVPEQTTSFSEEQIIMLTFVQ